MFVRSMKLVRGYKMFDFFFFLDDCLDSRNQLLMRIFLYTGMRKQLQSLKALRLFNHMESIPVYINRYSNYHLSECF